MAKPPLFARWALLAFCLFLGCNEGLEPPQQGGSTPSGTATGLITFLHWEAVDSLYDIRLVAFTVFPPQDILSEVLQGRAIVYPPLQAGQPLAPRGTDSLLYSISMPANTYPYVVIAHQFGPDVFSDWRPVGQYDLDTNLTIPSPLVVSDGQTTPGVDILVDFEHPPPFFKEQ
jgi:hypothetical protein